MLFMPPNVFCVACESLFDGSTAWCDMKYVAYVDSLTLRNKLARLFWAVVRFTLFYPLPGPIFKRWRSFVLKIMGAKIGKHCDFSNTCRIWAPWNLEVGQYVAFGPHVECYNVAKVSIGSMVTVSQDAYLCTASHDITSINKPLKTAPILIGDYAWVCAKSIVLPDVQIGVGSVVAAGAVVTKAIEPWTVVAGNPARVVKKRELRHEEADYQCR